jgi:hypothetical protein
MAKYYITNTKDFIDWDQIINDLGTYTGSTYGYHYDYENKHTHQKISESGEKSLPYHDLRDPNGEIYKAFENTKESLEFTAFYVKNGYEKELDEKVESLLNCKIFFSWISKVNPGKCVLPHIDDEEIYHACSVYDKAQLVRYHIHVSKPSIGAAFFIDEECYYFEPQGTVYQWPQIDGIHGGMNAGTKPKFLYHVIAVPLTKL